MESSATAQTEEKTTIKTKTLPKEKRVPGAVKGGVSNKVEQFRVKTEALSKPTVEWTTTNEDPL